MLGMFRPSAPRLGGLLWKRPWRLSPMQKARQRKRLRLVDRVVDTLSSALSKQGMSAKAVERWYAEMPREEEMLPRTSTPSSIGKKENTEKEFTNFPNGRE